MRIATFKVKNYKSFYDSPEVHLTSGFNVVVGENNAGKTAFIEALSLNFGNIAHKSVATSSSRGKPLVDQVSKAEIAFELSRQEFIDILDTGLDFYVPIATTDVRTEVET